MVRRQPPLSGFWPDIWLISDARNDASIEAVLARLPRGSGFVFRHYHLGPAARRARFDRLARIARRRGHVVVQSGSAADARRWGADGTYGPAGRRSGGAIPAMVTAHSLREIAAARRARADAILLSPAFATRSHPGGKALGPVCFRLLAARAGVPVIALGGMTAHRARRLRIHKWAAIDGLCAEPPR